MNKQIVVHLSGGLGNQLFQFMAGVGFAEATGRKLVINTNFFQNPRLRNHHHSAYTMKRRLEINAFDEPATTAEDRLRTPRDGRFERLLLRLPETAKRNFGIATEESFIRGSWIKPEEIHRLVGYFMSPKFFLNSNVEERFQNLVNPLNPWTSQMAEKMSKQKSIGVHVRLGDYLLQDDILIPTEMYFLKAIDYLNNLLGSRTKVFLFSDEPLLLVKKFPALAAIAEIVNPPTKILAAENLLLLSKSSAFVCSNSTFSWWASRISRTPNSLVVHPHTFYHSKLTDFTSMHLWDGDTVSIDPITGSKVI